MTDRESSEHPWPSSGKAWYAVGILVIAFIFSFVDRIIIGLLVGPIRADLGVSDFAIGMLGGFAFAVFYAVVGIPIGRLSDRYNRKTIITLGVVVWSLLTAACGLAKNFWQLFAARVGVGVGESALSPAAYSIIADYFPREKLGRALGVYQAGAFVGAGMSFLIGGLVIGYVLGADDLSLPLIGEVRPWQMVFFIVGLPGLLVALLVSTISEPERRGLLAGSTEAIPFGQVLGYVKQHRRLFVAHFFGFSLLAVPVTTTLIWVHVLFTRVYGLEPDAAALQLGTILIFASPAGVYFGGWLVDFLQRRGYPDAPFRVGIGIGVFLLPLSYLATTADDVQIALWLFGPFIFAASVSIAAAPAALQMVTPNRMRAQVSAAWMLFLNIVAATAGPTAAGFVTSYIFVDDMAVGASMALVNCIAVPVAALALWSGLGAFRTAVQEQHSVAKNASNH